MLLDYGFLPFLSYETGFSRIMLFIKMVHRSLRGDLKASRKSVLSFPFFSSIDWADTEIL